MKNTQTIKYYSKLSYVGENWRETRERLRKKRLRRKEKRSIIKNNENKTK